MSSPFPGMDPYLEPHWPDVHTALISEARRALNRALPKGLIARAEERVAVESEGDYSRRVGPDVRVFSPSSSDPHEGESGIFINAPYKIVVELDPIVERFIRVEDDAGQLISVIEFLSPGNKRQPGLSAYRQKRGELLAADVHVVEVDLVRAGDWRSLMLPERCPAEAVAPYRAVIRTSGARPGGYLFPISLRERLPDVPVPLRPGEQPVKLPMQALIGTVYADGRYEETLDYSREVDPPLEAGDAAWVDELLHAAGRR